MLLLVSVLLGSRVAAMLALGELLRQGSCRGCGGCPSQGLARGVHLALLLFVSLFLALLCLSCAFGCCSGILVLLLPPLALLSVAAGAALTTRAQVEG